MKKRWSKARQNRRLNWIIWGLALAMVIPTVIGFYVFRTIDSRYPWLWTYVDQKFESNPTHEVSGAKHLMFIFVDHFEPHDQETMERWVSAYREVVKDHVDRDGKRPQHTWFWYFSQSEDSEKSSFLRQLSELAYENLGEIEIHMHHYKDTGESFSALMQHAAELSQDWGALSTVGEVPRTAFGFIHGLWSLDNSRGEGACGVNNELIVLRKLGCYADFTHPSWGPMHPRVINKLYYATDDPQKPKSYETGVQIEAGKPGVGDLLIFTGPSVVRWNGIRPVYDHGDVTMEDIPTYDRIDAWVETGVHVKGRPEWIFIKVFTHGAVAKDHEAVLGKWRDQMHDYLEGKYNDGENYILHYVTAREAYNIAKAAEAGKMGDPNDYRDFIIPPYVNRFFNSSMPFETIKFTEQNAVIRFKAAAGDHVNVRFRVQNVIVTEGAEVHLKTESKYGTELDLLLTGSGMVGFSFGGTNGFGTSSQANQ